MGYIIRQLCRPYAYYYIKHPKKNYYVWYVPLLLSVFFTGLFFLGGDSMNLVYKGGVVDEFRSFLSSMPGFYIAALAAIATFDRPSMDMLISDPAPKAYFDGVLVKLTRRRFLSMLFSFLVAKSIVLIVFMLLVVFVLSANSEFISGFSGHYFYELVVLFVFIFFIMQLLVATFWGLFYLGDKVHRST